MSLKETLANDLKTAMKEKDTIRKNAVQMVRAAILQVEKDQKIVLDDADVIDVVARELKRRKDSLPDFIRSGRQDLVDNINREIEVLSQYMPEQMPDNELEELVRNTINEVGATTIRDIGKVMKVILPKVKGKADGSKVNSLIRRILES
ncbi:MAG: GatB/YqeY domain-containing protein [Ruminiclostridium sp.]|nr:GatB/YqeY domain-containing protein [Ruminiclostridium sp.]